MNHVRRQLTCLLRWALLLVLGLVQVAHAQGTATVDQYCFNNNGGSCQGTWKNSSTEACQEGADYYTAQSAGIGQSCTVSACSGKADVPANRFACTLTLGYVYNNGLSYRSASGTLPCPSSGTKEIRDFTVGYSTSPNSDGLEFLNSGPSFGDVTTVVGSGRSCLVNVGGVKSCWAATQPNAQGLYRFSCDYEITHTGSSSTPTATERASTDTANPLRTCVGASGTVNGKPVCVTTNPRQPYPASTSGAPTSTGNPPAGSSGSDSLGNRTPSSGANNDNAGSTSSSQDGITLQRGTGLPSNGGTTAGSTSGSTLKAEDIKTDCDKKPNSIGCSEYGTPDGSVTLGRTDSGFSSIAVVSFGSAASCPAPLPFDVAGRSYSVSFQSICTNANDYIRPVVLVLAAALAAFIFVAGFRS